MRSQSELRSQDLEEGMVLRDCVYDERVVVAGVYVGSVYLRWPHQENKTYYECTACGETMFSNLEAHAENCDEFDYDEYMSKVYAGDTDTIVTPVNLEGAHIESHSYSWPLDGHRFTVENKANQ